MADAEDIQPLVVDNGTGMVKVSENDLQVDALLCASCFLNVYLIFASIE